MSSSAAVTSPGPSLSDCWTWLLPTSYLALAPGTITIMFSPVLPSTRIVAIPVLT